MLTETSVVILTFSFISLVIFSIFYAGKREYLGANIMLVILSYFQGLILAVIFYSDNINFLFLTSILFGIYYYLLLSKLSMLFEFARYKLKNKTPATLDADLTEAIAMLWGLPADKIRISIYPGEKSNNVFKKISLRNIDIYVGEEFLKNFSRDELTFALSHEVAHTKISRLDSAYPFIFPTVYEFISIGIFFGLVVSGFLNIPVFFMTILVLFISGILIVNHLTWRIEVKADELGLIKSKNLNNAISLFEKFFESQKDYGQILNLIFYDHPLPRDRIKHLKKIKLES
jgi:Zn-dependent protease with chaperone function